MNTQISLEETKKILSYLNCAYLLKRYKNCTCIFCGSNFDYTKIKTYIDNGNVALCPICGIDAVVPTEVHNKVDNYKITNEIREELKKYFGG